MATTKRKPKLVKIDQKLKKLTTPEFRVSFPALFEPQSFEDGPAKRTLTMLFEQDTDISVMKKAAHWACVESWGKDKTKWPKKLRSPFCDGNDKPDLDGYKDTIYVKASTLDKVQVVDRKKNPITEEDAELVYAGCYARATLRAFTYDKAGNVGVTFALENVQKLRDGEPFSGRQNAVDAFDDLDDEDGGVDSDDSDEDGGF